MKWVEEWRVALKSRALPRQKRWRLLAGVVTFYLVRDILLYILLPGFLWIKAQ
jgi:hypothetical protein